MKYILVIFTFFLLLLNSLLAQNQNYYLKEKIDIANKYYEKHQFKKAIRAYKTLFKKYNLENGYIFYNIGTSYLKLHQLGKAIYWFKKAKFFIPLNSSLNKNLQTAISKTKDNFENKIFTKYLDAIFFLTKIFSIKHLFYTTIFFFYTLILFLIFKIFTYKLNLKKIFSNIIIVSGMFFIIFLLNFSWDYYKYNFLKIGFITKNNVKVRSDFNDNADSITTVNDGTELLIKKEENNYYNVKLINGVAGWVKKENIINFRSKN